MCVGIVLRLMARSPLLPCPALGWCVPWVCLGRAPGRRGKSSTTGAYCVRYKPPGTSVYVVQKEKVVLCKEDQGGSPIASDANSPSGSQHMGPSSGRSTTSNPSGEHAPAVNSKLGMSPSRAPSRRWLAGMRPPAALEGVFPVRDLRRSAARLQHSVDRNLHTGSLVVCVHRGRVLRRQTASGGARPVRAEPAARGVCRRGCLRRTREWPGAPDPRWHADGGRVRREARGRGFGG